VNFTGTEYQFSIKPEVPPGLMVNPTFTFQSGIAVMGDQKVPITQLTLTVGGTAITAKTTDLADAVMKDFVDRVDTALGYSIANNIRERYYQSSIMVEFAPGLERQIASFERAQKVLESEIRRHDGPFYLKRLAFGSGEGSQIPGLFTIDDIPRSDFTIERRAGEPAALNRYFCSAPLPTEALIRVLGLVENAMGN
ncbi:MAG TPA: hypothetical protein VNV18_04290, partial [Stellaceae bacterium]|nr:hypothetical protein [Stellaceae bacterium]